MNHNTTVKEEVQIIKNVIAAAVVLPLTLVACFIVIELTIILIGA